MEEYVPSMDDLVAAMYRVLADTYVLAIKTQNAHWNTLGRDFYQDHLLFERLYDELTGSIDRIAENTRALGVRVPAAMTTFVKLSSLSEFIGPMEAEAYLQDLLADQALVKQSLRAASKLAAMLGEEGIVNMVGDRMEAHGTATFLLTSCLGKYGMQS